MPCRFRNRVALLVLTVVVLSTGVAIRLVSFQVYRVEEFRERAGRQQFGEELVPARRGAILDRFGRELALSVETHSLYAWPARIQDVGGTARTVAALLRLNEASVRERLDREHGRPRVARGLTPDDARAIRNAGLLDGDRPKFELEREISRAYPLGTLGAHVVGFAGVDLQGIAGIECVRQSLLQGEPERVRTLQDGLGHGFIERTLTPAEPHRDVVLSLDAVLQHIVERELDAAMRDTEAEAALAIMLDPRTGEVLALANRPTPALDAYSRSTPESQRNRALADRYEPGSTFKVFTAAALLDAGVVQPSTPFDCEMGKYRVADRTFTDHDPFGTLTFREVVEHSSNIGMIKASRPMPGGALEAAIRKFGFGAKTGIELPEDTGNVPELSRGSAVQQASTTIGYGVSVTALQIVSAMGAIANGGVLHPPRLVRGTLTGDGSWTEEPRPEPVTVVSPRTARLMASILEGVVERGTGKNAAVPGWRIAGKTGTARKHIEGVGYSREAYFASFVGFAPVDDPQVVLLVVIDSPRKGLYYGGQAAAPVFRRIVADTLARLRVPPSDGERVVSYPGGATEYARAAKATYLPEGR